MKYPTHSKKWLGYKKTLNPDRNQNAKTPEN